MKRLLVALALILGGLASTWAIEITPANPVPPFTPIYVLQTTPNERITLDPVLTDKQGEQLETLSEEELELLWPDLIKTAKEKEFVFFPSPGLYVLRGEADQGGVTVGVRRLVRVLDPCPEPTPKPDPIPDPDVDPTPDPGVLPFPSPDGLAVMILRETAQTNLPPPQAAIFTSVKMQQWLNANVAKTGTNGVDRAWRLMDDDLTDEEIKHLPDLMKVAYRKTVQRSGGTVPWIGISNGRKGLGFSGPLPINVEKTIQFLEGYK